jgi:regulator of protease activity HflC (stomatin/prohibitin superfamily)
MRKTSLFPVALAATLALAGCSRVVVEPGHEAVFNAKPFVFGRGGVDSEPLKSGSTWVAITTDGIDVNMLPQTFDEEFKDIMPKDNNPVDYHAAVRLKIVDSVKIVSKFGTNWYRNNVQRPFQTMNRNQVRQYSMPDLALQQEVVIKVEKELKTELTAYLKQLDLPVEVQDVTLGRISPAAEIIAAYNQTGVQQQRAKTEHQRALAEEARKEAETRRAMADRAYQDAMGLNAAQYIQLQQIRMCGEKPNCTVVLGGAMPQGMFNVK